MPLLYGIEKLIDQKLEAAVIEGFEPTKSSGKPQQSSGKPDFRNKPKRNDGNKFNRNKSRPPRKRD
jgi:hypothetical protein